MDRVQIIQNGLLVAGCLLLGFLGAQYVVDKFLGIGLSEPAYYADVATIEPEAETAAYRLTAADKELYAKHLTTINDPQVGCGCPSCCSVRPS